VRRAYVLFASVLLPFLALATLNSAGYRFGASDQAFYVPAIFYDLDPTLYPSDAPLIVSQAKLTVIDEVVAGIVRVTGLPLTALFAILYVATLGLLAWAAIRIGHLAYRTTWATVALLAALTLRHAIIKSGTNTLEAYFHPRQLAFALGALALADFLRPDSPGPLRRRGAIIPLLLLALLIHSTTAVWFCIWLGVAAFVCEQKWRPVLALAGATGAIAAVWMIIWGPLQGRLSPMDDVWLATLAGKEYLFPLGWPVIAWIVNLGYVPLILWLYRRRRAAGVALSRETGVVIGAMALVAVFAAAVLLQAMHVALAFQMQPARIFWMLDFLATIYAVWALAEMGQASERRAAIVASVVLALSCLRGGYVLFVRFPERPAVQLGIRDDDWGRVMAWARTTSVSSQWLADPYHAALYGTSLRVAGQRDVFLEEIKDTAIGMYDRPVAMRTSERIAALGDFAALTPARARDLAQRYGLDYLVTEQPMDLPLAFSSGAIRVYRLR
jgi:hypothetical protein